MIPLMYLSNTGGGTPLTGSGYTNPMPSVPIPPCSSSCDNTFIPPANIGDVYEGGYYAGAMKVGSDIFALIVSDKTQGLISNKPLSSSTANLTTSEFNSINKYDGYISTQMLLNKFKNLTSSSNPALHTLVQLVMLKNKILI